MSHRAILERLLKVQELNSADLEEIFLPKEHVVKRVKKMLHELRLKDVYEKEQHIDAANMEPAEVRSWLSSLGLDRQEVEIVWLNDRDGARMGIDLFIMHYDELWYPSSDDIMISNATLSWILTIDHEEMFTLWKKKR